MSSFPERNGAATNLSDLSVRLGLSVSTVSRALRNAEGVDVATRARVLAEAARAGYRGLSRSPGNRAGGTRTMLVLSRGDVGMVPYDALAGVSRSAIELNISIVTHQTPPEAPESILQPKWQPPALRAGQVDGIILSQDWPESVVEELGRLRPLVSLFRAFPGIDHVGIDPFDGMDRLVGCLAEGDLGFYGGDGKVSFTRQLAGAFQTACGDHGRRGFHAADWQEALKMAQAGTRAWICSDVTNAEILAERFRGAGWRVPGDVALAVFLSAGYTGRPTCWTALTTNLEDLGAAAVRCLHHRIEAPLESVRRILLQARVQPGDPALVAPGSSAIPPL